MDGGSATAGQHGANVERAAEAGETLAAPFAGPSCISHCVQIQCHGETSRRAGNDDQSKFMKQDAIREIRVEGPKIELVKQMESRLQKVHPKPPGTIYRVPHILLRTGPDAYQPRVVSIGPYHHHYHYHYQQHSEDKLKDMQETKWRYLHDFLQRNKNRRLQECIHAIGALEGPARDRYSENVGMRPDQLVEIMVLDSCFLIELFLKQFFDKFEIDDPVYTISWLVVRVAYDLLLLENQLPFFIIQSVFDLYVDKSIFPPLQNLAMNFFRQCVRMNKEILKDDLVAEPNGEVYHLLHLFYLNLRTPVPLPPKPGLLTKIMNSFLQIKSTGDNLPTTGRTPTDQHLRPFPSVERLKEAGIKLRRGRGIGLLDIVFRDGVLEIPHFYIEDSTNSFIRNLCALEQFYPMLGNHFTLYSIFMCFAIDTREDVEILRRHRILEHTLGSDEMAIELFNWPSNGTSVRNRDNYLTEVCEQINAYCQKRLHVWRAKLKHDYFSNPWASLSVLAALFLLSLTVIQSSFSILQYCFPPPPPSPPPPPPPPPRSG